MVTMPGATCADIQDKTVRPLIVRLVINIGYLERREQGTEGERSEVWGREEETEREREREIIGE